jgi:hypothetical protein
MCFVFELMKDKKRGGLLFGAGNDDLLFAVIHFPLTCPCMVRQEKRNNKNKYSVFSFLKNKILFKKKKRELSQKGREREVACLRETKIGTLSCSAHRLGSLPIGFWFNCIFFSYLYVRHCVMREREMAALRNVDSLQSLVIF